MPLPLWVAAVHWVVLARDGWTVGDLQRRVGVQRYQSARKVQGVLRQILQVVGERARQSLGGDVHRQVVLTSWPIVDGRGRSRRAPSLWVSRIAIGTLGSLPRGAPPHCDIRRELVIAAEVWPRIIGRIQMAVIDWQSGEQLRHFIRASVAASAVLMVPPRTWLADSLRAHPRVRVAALPSAKDGSMVHHAFTIFHRVHRWLRCQGRQWRPANLTSALQEFSFLHNQRRQEYAVARILRGFRSDSRPVLRT